MRDITAIYFGMISAVDHQVGRILDALDAKGELDNTYIIFTSDHGEWLGDHGLLLKGPMMYDGLLRVPCLIHGPGVPKGRVIDDPIGTIDILATSADLCAVDTASTHGVSWRGLWNGTQVDADEMVNLFDDPSHAKVQKEHMDMIRSRANHIIPAAPRIGWH